MSLANMLAQAEQYFMDVVDQGSDQQLFIAGYVQGHYSLSYAKLQQQAEQSVAGFKQLLLASLAQAFAKSELEAEDQQQAYALVDQLFDNEIPSLLAK